MNGYLSALIERAQSDAPPVAFPAPRAVTEAADSFAIVDDLQAEGPAPSVRATPVDTLAPPASTAVTTTAELDALTVQTPTGRNRDWEPISVPPSPIAAPPTHAPSVPLVLAPQPAMPDELPRPPEALPVSPSAGPPRDASTVDESEVASTQPSADELLARVDAFLRQTLAPPAPVASLMNSAPLPPESELPPPRDAEPSRPLLIPEPPRPQMLPHAPAGTSHAGDDRERPPELTIGRITVDVGDARRPVAAEASKVRTVVVNRSATGAQRRGPTHRFGIGQI